MSFPCVFVLRLLAALCAAAVLSATGAIGASAQTVPGTRLSLTNFGYMANDAAHGHVFITGGSSDSSIIVRNVDGSAVTTITGESGAGGMVVKDGTLYVARCGSGDDRHLRHRHAGQDGSIAAASISAPCDLALAGGRLWYATSDPLRYLASVPLDGSAAETLSNVHMHGRDVRDDPAHPDWLVVGNDSGASTVKVIDASTAPATPDGDRLQGRPQRHGLHPPARDQPGRRIAVPGGHGERHDHLVRAAEPRHPGPGVQLLRLPGRHRNQPRRRDGRRRDMGAHQPGRQPVHGGGASPTRTYQFGSTETLRDGGLLYTSDGTHIFAVTKDSLNGVLFHSLATGNLPAGTLTIKASAGTVTYGKSVTLTAHLGTASANRTVSIYRHGCPAGRTRWSRRRPSTAPATWS